GTPRATRPPVSGQPGVGQALALAAWLAMTALILLIVSLLSGHGWLAAAVVIGVVGSIVAADVAMMVELWSSIGAPGLTRAGAPYWLWQRGAGAGPGPARGAALWLADDHFLPAVCHICFAALAVPFVIGLTRPARPVPTQPTTSRRPEWAHLDRAS